MDSGRFEELVARAVEGLSEEFKSRLENVDIVVEDEPTPDQLAEVGLKGKRTLLGLYHGIPLTERSSNYGMVAPDIISIFQKPIEAICHNDDEIVAEIQRTVRHEIAHHFGISDARLKEIEKRRRRNR